MIPKEIVDTAVAVLRKHRALKASVFGSFARGEAAEDIDLLFENVHDKEKIVAMKEYLEKKIGKRIDIVFDEFANPIILHRAKRDLKYVKKYQ